MVAITSGRSVPVQSISLFRSKGRPLAALACWYLFQYSLSVSSPVEHLA